MASVHVVHVLDRQQRTCLRTCLDMLGPVHPMPNGRCRTCNMLASRSQRVRQA